MRPSPYPSAPTPQEASGLLPHPGQPLRGASWWWGHQGAVQTPQDQGTHAATRHPLLKRPVGNPPPQASPTPRSLQLDCISSQQRAVWALALPQHRTGGSLWPPGSEPGPRGTQGYDFSLRSSCGWTLWPAQPLLGSRCSQERKTASPQGKEGFSCRPVSAQSLGSRHGASVPVHRENTLLGLFAKCRFWTNVRKSLSE